MPRPKKEASSANLEPDEFSDLRASLEKSNAGLIELETQKTQLLDRLEEANAEIVALKLQLDAALAKSNAVAGADEPFDATKRYKLGSVFAGIVGNGQRLDYDAEDRIADPYVLKLLHDAGADLIRC